MLATRKWRLAAVCLFLTGCTKMCGTSHADMTPEQVVEAYLDTSLNMTDVKQRNDLLEYTTGDLKAAIVNASDDTIRQAYVDRRYKLLGYSVIERRDRTPRETEITFRLTYKDLNQSDKTQDAPQVTTENTVSVVREDGLWEIRDVMGHKTAIDFPVSDDSRITAKPGQISEPALDSPEPSPAGTEPAPAGSNAEPTPAAPSAGATP